MDQSSPFARSILDDVHGAGPVLPADRLLLRMLDEMEYGMLLIDGDGRLRHANTIGREELQAGALLQLQDGRVVPTTSDRRAAFHDAVTGALNGLRQLLTFGVGVRKTSIAVTPMPDPDDRGADGRARYALLIFGKRPQTLNLSVDFFARAHGLTGAESAVLSHLVCGHDPADIAVRQRVALSTIRSQIASVRAKTCTASIRELIDGVSLLPPIRPVVRNGSCRPAAQQFDGYR